MILGIEADIILFHPYDRWGFCHMPDWADELYLKYVTARYSAYHNVWWSLSNEYDLNPFRTIADWERYAKIIMENDPYGHMRSIHNCMAFYELFESLDYALFHSETAGKSRVGMHSSMERSISKTNCN